MYKLMLFKDGFGFSKTIYRGSISSKWKDHLTKLSMNFTHPKIRNQNEFFWLEGRWKDGNRKCVCNSWFIQFTKKRDINFTIKLESELFSWYSFCIEWSCLYPRVGFIIYKIYIHQNFSRAYILSYFSFIFLISIVQISTVKIKWRWRIAFPVGNWPICCSSCSPSPTGPGTFEMG